MSDDLKVELVESENISASIVDSETIVVKMDDTGFATINPQDTSTISLSFTDSNLSADFYPTADVSMNSHSLTSANSIKLSTSPTITPTQGQLYWDDADKTVAINLDTTHTVNLQLGQEQHVRCVNKTGVQINDGQVVYINDAQGNRPTIALADASNVTKCQVIGIATQDIANNAEGYVTTTGIVNNFNTSSFIDGAKLYLSASTPGALTATRPASPNFIVHVGTALNSTINGKIFVHPHSPLAADVSLSVDTDETAPTQKAVKAYVDAQVAAENLWNRSGTTLSPNTANDSVNIGTGTMTAGNAVISGDLTVDTNTLFVDATNNRVGLGTTSPLYVLDSVKSQSDSQFLRLQNTSSSNGVLVRLWNSGSVGGNILVYGPDYSAGSLFSVGAGGTAIYHNATGSFAVGTTSSTPMIFGTNSTEYMRLTTAGRLGIGTNNPTYLLDVNGEIRGTTIRGSGLTINGSPYNYISNTSSGVALYLTPNASSVSEIQFGYSGSESRGRIAFANATQLMSFSTNSTARLNILSDGSIGVGTAAPTFFASLVRASSGAGTILGIANTSTNGWAQINLNEADSATGGSHMTHHGSTHASLPNILRLFNRTATGTIQFGTNNTVRVIVTADGSLELTPNTTGTGIILRESDDSTRTAFSAMSYASGVQISGNNNGSANAGAAFRFDSTTGGLSYFLGSLGLATTAPTHSLTLGSTGTGTAIYNTADQTTNFERARQYWTTNQFHIKTENGGTGTARNLHVGSPSVQQIYAQNNSAVGIDYDINATSTAGFTAIRLANGTVSTASSGTFTTVAITPSVNQSGTAAYRALFINVTETATGSGTKQLIDAQLGGTSRFTVLSSGNVGIGTATPTDALDINSNELRLRTAKTPASATDTGDQGAWCWDSNYIYVCTATNTWKRAALSTW